MFKQYKLRKILIIIFIIMTLAFATVNFIYWHSLIANVRIAVKEANRHGARLSSVTRLPAIKTIIIPGLILLKAIFWLVYSFSKNETINNRKWPAIGSFVIVILFAALIAVELGTSGDTYTLNHTKAHFDKSLFDFNKQLDIVRMTMVILMMLSNVVPLILVIKKR